MLRKLGFLLVFFFRGLVCLASHLVGGEFEVIHLRDNTYLFRQIQYFDVLTGNPGAKDDTVQASIFRKNDNVYMRNVTLHLIEEEKVFYSNPSCEDFRLSTRRQVYQAEVTLDPEDFDDPGGYYMVWERCCRNISISNIRDPDETGQTFYIEFPELIREGRRFINSTPQLFPPLSDYACVNQFYYADFGGHDADGDSLVYSMADPLNSTVSNPQDPVPTPSPAPHASVNWASGFGVANQVPGSSPMKISTNGVLTAVPSQTGLFVFSVKVEEFRDGEKIGEVRRDFQLLVVDCPPPGHKPKVKVKQAGSDTYQESLEVVTINYGENSCFDLIVNDNDGNESIRIKAVPVNFVASLQENLSIDTGVVVNASDTLKLNFCFPQCILEGSTNPAIVDIFVYDDQCPQALMDTLRIMANLQQPPNEPPQINLPSSDVEELLFFEGDSFTLPFNGTDVNLDSLSMQIIPVGFSIEDYGITVDTLIMQKGEIAYELDWETDCNNYPLGEKNEFELMVVVEDFDACLKNNADTAYYRVRIELPPNNAPVLSLDGDENDVHIISKLEELIDVLVIATDEDSDEVSIVANPIGFDLADLEISFPDVEGLGSVQQNLSWQLFCGDIDLNVVDTFLIDFIAEDADKCRMRNADTLRLTIKLTPPENHAPELLINGQQALDTVFLQIGESVQLNISASDPDRDLVHLEMENEDSLRNALGIDLNLEDQGLFSAGELRWSPRCDHLNAGFEDAVYTFHFRTEDNKCYVPKADEEKVTVVVQDLFESYDFRPPNAFTPNIGDDVNRYYYVPELPLDNCASQFEEIIIYNRWGKEVFRSDNRDFQWHAPNSPSGVYYYSIMYTHKTFKGIINLIK